MALSSRGLDTKLFNENNYTTKEKEVIATIKDKDSLVAFTGTYFILADMSALVKPMKPRKDFSQDERDNYNKDFLDLQRRSNGYVTSLNNVSSLDFFGKALDFVLEKKPTYVYFNEHQEDIEMCGLAVCTASVLFTDENLNILGELRF